MRLSGESSGDPIWCPSPVAAYEKGRLISYFSRVSRRRRDSVPTLGMRFVYAEALIGQSVDRDENRFISRAGRLLCSSGRNAAMSDMLKVVEVLAESNKSWDDAAQNAVRRAAETLNGIKSIYIKDLEAVVSGDKITKYRINAKISFLLENKSK
jgi:dodecin